MPGKSGDYNPSHHTENNEDDGRNLQVHKAVNDGAGDKFSSGNSLNANRHRQDTYQDAKNAAQDKGGGKPLHVGWFRLNEMV